MTAASFGSGKRNASVLQLDMASKPKSLTVPKLAKTSYVRVRIDPKLKRKAEVILERSGLSISDATTVFFKQVVAQNGLPFEVRVPNRETIKAMRELEQGRGKSFSGTAEELFTHLLGNKRP